MKQIKTTKTAEEYCKQNVKSLPFINVLKHSYDIQFKERPDYAYIKFLLKKIVLDINKVPMKMFDWKNYLAYNRSSVPFDSINFDDLFKDYNQLSEGYGTLSHKEKNIANMKEKNKKLP